MKSFVVLSCVLVVAVAHHVPADTPEVAAAKAQHFAAHHEAQARNWAQDTVVNGQWVAAAPAWNSVWGARAGGWYAPSWQRWYNPAQISVVNGQVQDTPEVAAEKAKHFALYNEAAARSVSAGGHDGQWVDDVNVAIAPISRVAYSVPAVSHRYLAAAPAVHHVTGYVAPAVSRTWVAAARHHEPANIVVANGHVQDTPEVAAEKAKHLALVAETKARDAIVGKNVEWTDDVVTPVVAHVATPAVYTRVAAVAPVGADVHSQYHAQDEAGQYSYGYNGGLSTKNEEKSVDGVTRGAYSYVDANGLVQSRSYIADGQGFRVAATDLPQGPSALNLAAPVATVYSAGPAVYSAAVPVITKVHQPAQVIVKPDGTLEDTPEVAAAKAQHYVAHQQEKALHAGW